MTSCTSPMLVSKRGSLVWRGRKCWHSTACRHICRPEVECQHIVRTGSWSQEWVGMAVRGKRENVVGLCQDRKQIICPPGSLWRVRGLRFSAWFVVLHTHTQTSVGSSSRETSKGLQFKLVAGRHKFNFSWESNLAWSSSWLSYYFTQMLNSGAGQNSKGP